MPENLQDLGMRRCHEADKKQIYRSGMYFVPGRRGCGGICIYELWKAPGAACDAWPFFADLSDLQ